MGSRWGVMDQSPRQVNRVAATVGLWSEGDGSIYVQNIIQERGTLF